MKIEKCILCKMHVSNEPEETFPATLSETALICYMAMGHIYENCVHIWGFLKRQDFLMMVFTLSNGTTLCEEQLCNFSMQESEHQRTKEKVQWKCHYDSIIPRTPFVLCWAKTYKKKPRLFSAFLSTIWISLLHSFLQLHFIHWVENYSNYQWKLPWR